MELLTGIEGGQQPAGAADRAAGGVKEASIAPQNVVSRLAWPGLTAHRTMAATGGGCPRHG